MHPFDVRRSRTLDEALGLLARRGEPRCSAGGQSLIPLLNYRLAKPRLVIDLNGCRFVEIRVEADGVTARRARPPL